MGVHKASNNQGALGIRDDSDVNPGGVGPAADPLRPEGGREDERADAACSPVPSELLSFKPKQSGLVQSESSWTPSPNLDNFQVLLHKHLELFLNPDLLHAKTMCAIFQVFC